MDNKRIDENFVNEFYAENNARKRKNSVAIGLSAAALVVALSTSATAMYGYHKISVGEYQGGGFFAPTQDDITSVVKSVYADSINAYMNNEITYDEMSEQVAQMIMDRMNGKFTEPQEQELIRIIEMYINSTTIYSDIESNKQAIESVSNLLEDRYNANRTYIINVENALNQMIKENGDKDDARYNELVAMDKKLKSWINDASSKAESDNKKTRTDLTQMIDELKALMNKNDEDMSALIKSVTGAEDYVAGKAYAQGDYILVDGKLFVSLQDDNKHAITDTAAFKETDIENIIRDLMLDMDSKFVDMQKCIDKMNKDINDKMDKNQSEMNAKVDSNQAEINSKVDANQAEINDKLDTFKADTTDYLEKLKKYIDEEDKNSNDRLTKTDAKINNRISDVESQSKADLNDAKQLINSRIDDVESALNDDITDTNAYVARVEDALGELQKLVNKHYADVNNKINSESAAASKSLTDAKEKLTNDINDLHSYVDQNRAEIDAKINAINNYKYEIVTNSDGTHSLYITEVE